MSKYYDGVEFPFCDEFSKYEKMAKIGQGTFGWVVHSRLVVLLNLELLCKFRINVSCANF